MIGTLQSGHAPGRAQRVLLALVRGYRLFFSAWLGGACRFEPTCSMYALEAIERHGAAAGAYLACRRIVRCHPLCPGGFDPVPTAAPHPFRRVKRAGGADAANLPSP